MKKINESKNSKHANATINKVLNEISYAEEYIKRWNSSWQEQYSNVYSIDLYYLSTQKIQEIEKLYHNQYYISDAKKSYTRTAQPLKKVILKDKDDEEYSCEFGEIEWYGMTSNKTIRSFIFKNDGNIAYSQKTKDTKNKSSKINYTAKYNVNSNELNILFETNNEKINTLFKNNLITIKKDNLFIEIDMINGSKKISFITQTRYNQSILFEIIIDKNKNIISKSIEINNYNQDNKISSIYNLYYTGDELKKAVIKLTQTETEHDVTNNPETINMINKIILNCSLSNPNLCMDEDKLEELIESQKDKLFNYIKTIKGDIPLQGLSKRLDIALAMIRNKVDSNEQKQINNKKQSKKINHKRQ